MRKFVLPAVIVTALAVGVGFASGYTKPYAGFSSSDYYYNIYPSAQAGGGTAWIKIRNVPASALTHVVFSTSDGTAQGGSDCSGENDYVRVSDRLIVQDHQRFTLTPVKICAAMVGKVDRQTCTYTVKLHLDLIPGLLPVTHLGRSSAVLHINYCD